MQFCTSPNEFSLDWCLGLVIIGADWIYYKNSFFTFYVARIKSTPLCETQYIYKKIVKIIINSSLIKVIFVINIAFLLHLTQMVM
jgi:hypothetical protein